LAFFLGFLGPTVKVLFIGILSKFTNGGSFGHFGHGLLLLATLAMNTNGESYVIWNLPSSNLWHPAPPHASSRSPEIISGIPLCKQELLLQEATMLACD